MGESVIHKNYIDVIYKYSLNIVPQNHSSLIQMDGNENLLVKEVPPIINGFRPDLYYEFNSLLIIGEAKTRNDYATSHSLSQYTEYINYCEKYNGKSYLIFCCPWTCTADLKLIIKRLTKKCKNKINIIFLDEMSNDKKDSEKKNMQKMKLVVEPTYKAIFDAYDYQKEAVDAIKDLEYGAIFHEQGLGKTKIAIDILLYWLNNQMLDVVLIVTKKQLVSNWIGEIREHTGLRPAVLTSDKSENYFVFNGKNRIIVTNFEVLSSEIKRFRNYLDILNVGIIIDESAKLKNPESKLTQTYFELGPKFKKRIIMTGTPIANRPYDIWSQIYFLDRGKSLGKNYKEFKAQTNLSNDLFKNKDKAEIYEETVSHIFSKISSFTVRETKASGIISLPDKVYKNVYVDFEAEQFDMYEHIRKEMQMLVEKNEEIFVDDSSASLKRLLRLVQVTSNPKLLDELYFGPSAKEKALEKLINSIIEKGEKCIVWSSFIENIDSFHAKYREKGSVKIHGRMNMEARIKSVDRFKHDPSISILFATPQSAKEGLTLTVANHVIFYDRGFSLDDYLQAQDRIHRISQKKTCYIYNLMVKNSIDEWVDILLKAKNQSAKLGQGDIGLNEYRSDIDYSFGEIIKNILGGNMHG